MSYGGTIPISLLSDYKVYLLITLSIFIGIFRIILYDRAFKICLSIFWAFLVLLSLDGYQILFGENYVIRLIIYLIFTIPMVNYVIIPFKLQNSFGSETK